MTDDPEARRLAAEQRRREADERAQAEESASDPEHDQHERRADKAGYLRRKLAERADSEVD